ncbi:MAG TPA: hypothetical protein ENJ87_12400 [Gammaproteobacteria bacterium]|nr:hypothetical protein [Gammaproteobacteria bacterium]
MPESPGSTVRSTERNQENIELAQRAADNEVSARKKVNELIRPIIRYQTNRFCKRFCKENCIYFKCTLDPPVNACSGDSSLCEWGNGSYAWMLDDLSSSKRLKKFRANNNATLFDYCYVIANSMPFYERWKDWRFGRKIYVPRYIRDLGKTAVTVFFGLRSQQSYEMISQSTSKSVEDIQELSRRIIQLLTKKNRLHLLNAAQSVSFSHEPDDGQARSSIEAETASHDEAIDKIEDRALLTRAWKQLSPVEQFVIEALVIDEQDAEIVLNTLKKLDLSIKKGVDASSTDRQQLYYFRRKTLAKLYDLMKPSDRGIDRR